LVNRIYQLFRKFCVFSTAILASKISFAVYYRGKVAGWAMNICDFAWSRAALREYV